MADTIDNQMNQVPLDDPQSPVVPAVGAPPATPTSVPAPAPVVPTAPPAQQVQNSHRSVLNHILTMATGGNVTYQDPMGQTQIAPQSNATLGKTLIAATLAGLLAKDEYVATPYGPRRDFSGTGANAVAASQGVTDKMRQAPQKLSDEAQSRKLFTLQTNANLHKIMSASALQQHQTLAEQISTNAPMLKNVDDVLRNLPTGMKAEDVAYPPMSMEEAQAKLKEKGYTNWIAVPSSTVSVLNPDTGMNEDHPMYRVVNPQAQITLSPEAADMAALTNPAYNNLHKVVGGEVKVPLGVAAAANQEVMTVHTVQAFNNELAKELGIDPTNMMAAVKKDRQLLPAIDAARDQIAAGGSLWRTLDAARSAPNGAAVLEAMGVSREQANSYIERKHNEETAESKLAEAGGIGDKAPASQQAIDDTNLAISHLPESDQTPIKAQMGQHMSNMQIHRVNEDIQKVAQNNKSNAIKAGDPAELATTASNIIEGDTTSLKDLLTSRENVKARANNILQQAARDRGLDPTRYTLEAQKHRAEVSRQYSEPNEKIGMQLQSFGKLLGHVNEAYDASEAWTRSGSPILNRPIAWLAKNAQNDQNFQRFQADIIAPAKEYINFLNQNRAEHESDIKAMDAIINDSQTPAGVLTALKSIVKTSDIQAAQLGKGYLQTVGTTYPVVDSTGVGILDRMLGKGNSAAAKVSQAIPRGWANGQASPMQPQVIQQIMAAAGNDPVLATRIAKENGWNPIQ